MNESILAKSLRAVKQEISVEQYHAWKQDPITQELFLVLAKEAVERKLTSPPPEDYLVAHHAYTRAGALDLIDLILDWQPQNVREILAGDDNENA